MMQSLLSRLGTPAPVSPAASPDGKKGKKGKPTANKLDQKQKAAQEELAKKVFQNFDLDDSHSLTYKEAITAIREIARREGLDEHLSFSASQYKDFSTRDCPWPPPSSHCLPKQ